MAVGWNGMASLPDQIKNNKNFKNNKILKTTKNFNIYQFEMWPIVGFMVSLWTVGKANHKSGFLSETDCKILKSYLPIIKSIKDEQRIPQFCGYRYVHACTLHRYTCAGRWDEKVNSEVSRTNPRILE